jgi:transcriptional regulator with XRE-family HTH domain
MGLSKKIAYRLQTLRESSGLSQQEVADRADLSLSLVAKMEQGRKADPRASTLLALADALGVRAGRLIEDLTRPPEGTFPSKRKKKGKKQKKRLAALVSVGGGETAHEGEHLVTPNAPDEGAQKPKKKRKKLTH